MSRANKVIANIYNPLNQDKQSLLDNFVVRQQEFRSIFRDLKKSKLNQTSQNFLIQGQRGTGKTTLLAKLRYEIEDSENLSHLMVIQFTEEQYNIFSLNRLWESVADILEEKSGFEEIVEEIEEYEDEDDLYFILDKYLKKNKKKLVLLVDNFGDILDKLKEKEHKKLRDILHESDLQIIAASTKTLETAYKHDKPFFESFKTIYMDALSPKDVQVLLENLSTQQNSQKVLEVMKSQKGRIEAIRRLTGGIPRTIILLYEIILDDSASVFEDLEGILDKITPLYKHKMDDLPTQQQVIVDAIALNWDGMLPSEISKKTDLETKAISSQLKALEKSGFITSKLINKKNKVYLLEERFFNIWYLMRYGRKKKKQQVVWLVSFLKEWCTEAELIQKAKKHITCAKSGTLHQRGGYYMAEALYQSIQDTELQYEVLTSTKKHISKTHPKLAESLPDADNLVFDIATTAYEKDFKKAEKYCLKAIENNDVISMNNLALLYRKEFKNIEKAEQYYLMAIENKYVPAMFNIALLYEEEYKDFKKAERYYLLAIENKYVPAMVNIALLYEEEYKDFKKAEQYYLMAIENKHVGAIFNLALLYDVEYKDFKKAEQYYLMAVENKHVGAMANLAWLYENEYKDFKKAEQYYLLAIENKYADAMFNLALIYDEEYKDFKKAEQYYLMAAEKKEVRAMVLLSRLYQNEYQDFVKAEQYYLMALEIDFEESISFLSKPVFQDKKEIDDFLSLAKQSHTATNYRTLLALSIMNIQATDYKESIKNFKLFLDLIKEAGSFQKHITNYLILLISRKQYQLALSLFQEPEYQLKDKVKPVYFALMSLMQDEYPKEYKRMGSEIADTVLEVLEKIKSIGKK